MFLTYAGFIAFVLAMLFVDIKFFHTEDHKPSTRQSGAWVAVWVTMAVLFGVILYFWKGSISTAEYFAGYLLEYSLSVDNMFVFLLIFGYFRIPLNYQHRVLFYGILGAIVMRGLFIAGGVALINRFEWIIYVFGAFLLYTAYRVGRGNEDVDPEDNPVLKLFKKRFRTTTKLYGQKLFTTEDGRKVATPLFVVLLVIETTDVVFAVDSIPAILAITRDPFIVLTSNVFAILGLRALYFLLAGSMDKFHLLRYGLAAILAFVGIKMLLGAAHVHIPIWLSLAFIVVTLAISVVASIKFPAPVDDQLLEAQPIPDPVPEMAPQETEIPLPSSETARKVE